jgi:hypothetical protein
LATRADGGGAAIADATGVETSASTHTVDLVHTAEPDEWCVTVDGERVLSFSGPSAWTKALSHKAELLDLLTHDAAESGPSD